MDPVQRQAMEAGRSSAAKCEINPLVAVKLWQNPCWFSFRINYLALHFNVPVYSWIERKFGLPRPEYVVLFSLALQDGVAARDICVSSGFPRNTISLAVKKLLEKKVISREIDLADRRSFILHLTDKGKKIFEQTLEPMIERERQILKSLSPAERVMLSELLAKAVIDSKNWPPSVTPEETQT